MLLIHGTTRRRAERIIARGPDPEYRDRTELPHKDGFSTYASWAQQDDLGSSRDYAVMKHLDFPNEGEPVILKMEVPDGVVARAVDRYYPLAQGIIVFNYGHGIEELLAVWPQVAATAIIEVVK